LEPLRRYWHPVGNESDLADDAPMRTMLLGEPLVVFRSGEDVVAARDLCLHRGARLSGGRVRDGRIICPYHGFEYDGTGQCVLIPSQPRDDQHIPARLRLIQYQAKVRYGLIWVALDEPAEPMPDFPEWDHPDWRAFRSFESLWQVSTARVVENILDISHFPFVHPGTLGDPDAPELPPFEVRPTDNGIEYDYEWVYPNEDAAHQGGGSRNVHYDYELTFPFTTRLTIHAGDGMTVLWVAKQPIADDETRLYAHYAVNHSPEKPESTWTDFALRVFAQDQPVVESQRPEAMPVDLTQEIHLRAADAPGIAYRKMLAELGLHYA
jgi:phenylpropionate dioxygenase-like ring-hydroxylating dioxygenase large terminal subunit